jgi:hypothetical protein
MFIGTRTCRMMKKPKSENPVDCPFKKTFALFDVFFLVPKNPSSPLYHPTPPPQHYQHTGSCETAESLLYAGSQDADKNASGVPHPARQKNAVSDACRWGGGEVRLLLNYVNTSTYKYILYYIIE